MITYNNMIQKLDTQHFSCFVNAVRHADVLRTGRRIAAGMVVYQHQPHRVAGKRLHKNLPWGNQGRVHSSLEHEFLF